jgi:predicted transcriptional regulator
MAKTIAYNELRRIKDSLPNGSISKIADQLGVTDETVRNYFGGHNYVKGKSCGVHIEPGPEGGIVALDDTTILEMALDILGRPIPVE